MATRKMSGKVAFTVVGVILAVLIIGYLVMFVGFSGILPGDDGVPPDEPITSQPGG